MFNHYSVMLQETIDLLDIKSNGIYVDMTLGGSGHSKKIYEKLNKDGVLIGFDQDITAINHAKEVFKDCSNVYLFNDNFSSIKEKLESINISKIDGVIFDLGVSSIQFDEKSRGFSYRFDYRLDMRMNQSQELSAYELVNEATFNDLYYYIAKYGEEKYAKQIARNIEKARELKPIETTFELVEIIKRSMPQAALKKKGHPAKKTFQALRIAVNNELDVFEKALEECLEMLSVDGRVVVITFHSLEDRICKQIFKKYTTSNLPKELVITNDEINDVKFELVKNKVIIPSNEELSENSRSKSSKLRVIKRIKE